MAIKLTEVEVDGAGRRYENEELVVDTRILVDEGRPGMDRTRTLTLGAYGRVVITGAAVQSKVDLVRGKITSVMRIDIQSGCLAVNLRPTREERAIVKHVLAAEAVA